MADVTSSSRLLLLGCLSVLSLSGWASLDVRQSWAQITPDNTLGIESSRLRAVNGVRDRIEGGAIRGSNLFHSFEEFNIGEGREAYFANPAAIANIFGRITGTDSSEILGTLGVDGTANLFLLNPNGIIFGPNARLDIRGSFVASTGDRFNFPDGSSFSATEPNAPPLLTVNLTPGLQMGRSPLINQGQLTAGQDLVLSGSLLDLEGRLTAGGDLVLQGDRVQILDSPVAPFIAQSGGTLTVAGNTVDISILGHPESQLVSGGDMVVRSPAPVIGDARYQSIAAFRIETPEGGLGMLESRRAPVIRANGDVSFQSYEGVSLHIFAGGGVTIPGEIVVTGAAVPESAVQERVTLSDGATVVEVDGSAEPTLDIRAGIESLEAIAGGTSNADVTLGNITNTGGTVLVTNQYRPNPVLRGDMTIGAIDTSVERFTAGTAQGGSVVLDGRDNLEIIGDVTTFAHTGDIDLETRLNQVRIRPDTDGTRVFAGDNARATGGNVTLLSGSNITMQNIETSAIAAAQAETNQSDRVGDANARAQAGSVVLRVGPDDQGTVSSRGNIQTDDINTFARAVADASAGISIDDSAGEGGRAIAGNATVLAIGGDIDISTQADTGNRAVRSDRATIRTGTLNASVLALADASVNGGNVTVAAGGATSITGRGGQVSLSTRVDAAEIRPGLDMATIRVNRIFTSAAAHADSSATIRADFGDTPSEGEDNGGDAGVARAGTIEGLVVDGGAIALSTQVTAGATMAESDLATIRADVMTSSALATAAANAFVSAAEPENGGPGGNARGGSLGAVSANGGTISSSSDASTGNVANSANVAALQMGRINASALTAVRTSADTRRAGGSAAAEDAAAVTSGGDLSIATTFSSRQGNRRADIGAIRTSGQVNTSARSLIDTNAAGEDTTPGMATFGATGGDINFRADGRILMGERSQLNTSAGVFSFSPEPEASPNPDEDGFSGGDISLIASDTISLSQIGAEIGARFEGGENGETEAVSANVLASSAGNLTVRTPSIIRLSDDGFVTVEATGQEGTAGNITFSTRFFVLGEQSHVSSETDSGEGGNIRFNLRNALRMQRGSRISTRGGTTGSGGNIDLRTRNGFVLARVWNSNTDITTDAFGGDGGRITIDTPNLRQLLRTRQNLTSQLLQENSAVADPTAVEQGVFGFIVRSRSDLETLLGTTEPSQLDPGQLPSNDITLAQASPSLLGAIVLQALEADPSRDALELPSTFIDVTSLLASDFCELSRDSNFISTGQGGLPPTPDELFTSEDIWQDQRLTSVDERIGAALTNSSDSIHRDATSANPDRAVPLVEAQSWVRDETGAIALIAGAVNGTPQIGWLPLSASCGGITQMQ